MAQLGGTFRPEDAPEGDDFAPVPAGDYLAQVIESDVGPTKNGAGTILKLVFEIMTGPHKGRRVWERLNISNPNATAQGIAQRALAELCTALGLPAIDDSNELHFKPVTIRVGIQQQPGYNPQNTIKKYIAAGAGGGGSAGAAPAQRNSAAGAQTAARPAAGGRPWGASR